MTEGEQPMALFTGKDKWLPLLTHIPHVDTEDLAEVKEFYFDHRLPTLEPSPKEAEYEALAADLFAAQCLMKQFAALEPINGVKYLPRHAMDPILARLQTIEPPRDRPTVVQDVITIPEEVPADSIPLGHARIVDYPQESRMDQLRRMVLSGTAGIMLNRPDMLRVCASCGHVFQRDERHPQQRYCSSRCSGRERKKEFRAKRKKQAGTLHKRSLSGVQ
jgi:hypothetical protein